MKPLVLWFALSGVLALPAHAALKVGETAPDFTVQVSTNGNPSNFSLARALSKGPVVVYFYPKAFACSAESRAFAAAMDQFDGLAASVIAVSRDDIGSLRKFSAQACDPKLSLAADPDGEIMNAWDTQIAQHVDFARRTTYVVTPDGKIFYTYSDSGLYPQQHVANALRALRRWRASR